MSVDEPEFRIREVDGVTLAQFHAVRILDAPHVERIATQLKQLVDDGCRKMALDFSPVKFLSSAMLGVLIQVREHIDGVGGELVLCGLQPALHKVFRISRLDSLFRFFDSPEQALSAWTGESRPDGTTPSSPGEGPVSMQP